MEEYRNILANKFMRDTNYIIIKDTDDLEELERQWELFQSSLTVRQQRLSDDRSLQIWNMTNQQHYEALKTELMGELQNKLGIEDDEPTSIEYEPDDDEKIDDNEITNFVNMSFDDFEIPDDENEINEPIKEAYDKSNEEQKKVMELDKFMRKNIKYGVFDRYTKKLEFNMYSICYSGRWLSNYKFLTPEEVEKLGGGQCVDQANYAHHKLLEAGIDNSIYFILGVHDVLKFDTIAHAFVLVKFSNGQYAYFDNASSGKTTIFKTYKDTIRYAKNVLRSASQHIYLKFNLYDVTDCMPSYGSNFYDMLDELLSNGTLIESEISDRYGNFDAAKMDYYESRNVIDFQMLKYKSMKEESIIPTDGKELNEKQKLNNEIKVDMNKDAQADQYEIDSNINIIGSIKGFTPQERLDNLEKAFRDWNSQNQDHRKKSDDKCREIYGMSNIDRYKKLKGIFVQMSIAKTSDDVSKTISNNTNSSEEALSEFTLEVYRNMQVVNEAESNKAKQHRRLNDTPYFTPSEMIDMGVHGNHNYYCKDADNDGLITRVRIPTWFDSYKDMCMDHIFEDYTKDWIDTLDYLYSDFEEIKESGNEEKILARKQSILDLGWNPEIPFTRRNRQLASKRVSKLLDKTSPMNLFINLDKEVPDEAITDEPVTENASKDTHQPIYIVFVQGKSPIISNAIKKVTNSPFSHSGISFDSKLDTVHSYNMAPKSGVVKETLSGYKDNVITVMAFFAPTDIYNTMKDTVMDYYINAKKTVYDWGIIFNKLINKNARVVNDKYYQVCSTFVDTILKSGKVTLDKDANVPSPAELYNATKSMPNKIIEVYSGPANKYDSAKVNKKMNKLLEKGTKAIDESKLTDKIRSKRANMDLELTAKTYDALSHLTKDEKKKAEMKKKAISARSMKGLLDFDEETITEGIHDIMNGTNPFSTKTFYHVSFDDNLDDEILKPRIPSWITNEVKKNPNFIKELEKLKDSNSTSGTGFEEYMTPRVCFSPSIEGCLNAIINEKGRMHLHNETLYVYIPEKPINEYKTKTNRQILKDGDIFDANVTQEMWILEPVKLKYVGSIVVDKITGEHIKKFANNKNKTNIKYDYKWHWFHKVKYRYNPEKNKFVTEASISDSKRVAIDIRDKTIAYLKKIVESDEYQQKWGKFKFFKDNINIYPTEYGDYKASINICDCSPWSVNADEYYDNPKEKQLFHKWYYDLLNKGKNFINNKFSSTLDKYDIYVSLGDEDECTIYLESKLNEKHPILFKAKSILAKESASILNEVKQFPVEFDQDGNLIIYKARIGSIAYGDDIDDSVKLLESYRNTNNIEGMKYELAKLWFINDSIEKKLKKKLTNDQYKELIDHRATCLNVFKLNLEYVMKAEKGFNFSDYYNSTPFSDNSVKITANTLKYSMKAIASMI